MAWHPWPDLPRDSSSVGRAAGGLYPHPHPAMVSLLCYYCVTVAAPAGHGIPHTHPSACLCFLQPAEPTAVGGWVLLLTGRVGVPGVLRSG